MNDERKDQAQANAFYELFEAAILDAAANRKMTQLKLQIHLEGRRPQMVRLVVVPETMDQEFGQPLQSI